MKALKLMMVISVIIIISFLLLSCERYSDNPFKNDAVDIPESDRQTPPEPPIPIHVVRSLEWGSSGCGGIAYDGSFVWLGGSACPWNPTCGNYYGISFGPTLEKHFEYGQVGPAGLTWDGNYLCLTKAYCFASAPPYTEIFKITTDGEYVSGSYFTVPFRATGLAWDGQYLWTIDYHAKNFKKLDPSGTVIDSIVPEITDYLIGLAFDGKYFWCSSEGKIYKISRWYGVLESFNQPCNLVADLACCGKCLLVLDSSGSQNKIFVVQVNDCDCPLDVYQRNNAK